MSPDSSTFWLVVYAISSMAAIVLIPLLTIWSVGILRHFKQHKLWQRIVAILVCCVALAVIGWLIFVVEFAFTF